VTRAFRAELLKLRTTRATWGILAGAVAIAVVAFAAPGDNVVQDLTDPLHEQQATFFIGFMLRVLLVVLGVRAITDEWRHGTLTPSLVAMPRRGRFLLVKTAATAAFGVAVTTAATLALVGTALAYAQVNDVALGETSPYALAGMALSGGLWAAIGVGLGAILKSQLVATVTGLVWLMAVDDMLRERLGDLAGYLPGQAGLALVTRPDLEVAARSALTLLAYAVVAFVAGTLLTNRRDVT